MTTISPALYEVLAAMIPRISKGAVRRYPLIDLDDFEQEMWLRACASAERYNSILSQSNARNLIWHELNRACNRYGNADDRDRRARKAAANGYKTFDEVFYTHKMTGHILRELIESEFDTVHAMERATKGLDLSGTRLQDGDVNDAFVDYLTMIVDVKGAYDKLKPYQQNMLYAWYGCLQDDTDEGRWERQAKASSMGLTYDAFRMRASRALDALIQQIGGRNPYIRQPRQESEKQ